MTDPRRTKPVAYWVDLAVLVAVIAMGLLAVVFIVLT